MIYYDQTSTKCPPCAFEDVGIAVHQPQIPWAMRRGGQLGMEVNSPASGLV